MQKIEYWDITETRWQIDCGQTINEWWTIGRWTVDRWQTDMDCCQWRQQHINQQLTFWLLLRSYQEQLHSNSLDILLFVVTSMFSAYVKNKSFVCQKSVSFLLFFFCTNARISWRCIVLKNAENILVAEWKSSGSSSGITKSKFLSVWACLQSDIVKQWQKDHWCCI